MNKTIFQKGLLFSLMVALFNICFISCSDNNKQNDESGNTTDVAVTSNISKLGATYAHINGYVNLNQITSSYTNLTVGVELSMDEDFKNARQTKSTSLEGNKLTVVIDTLSGQTKYYYRTFVKVNKLNYYGEKRSFTTKDFSNITFAGDASDLTFTSAKINCKADVGSIENGDKFTIGIAYSATKNQLHPDSIRYDNLNFIITAFNVVNFPIDGIKDNSFEVSISQLQTGKTYYYCSFTRAGRKYKFGEIKSFTTNSLSPSQLSTGDATDITIISATIKNLSTISELYPKGTSISYGVRYSTTEEGLNVSGSYKTVNTTAENNTFTTFLDGLSSGTTYYYYAFVGVDGIVLTGEIKSFTTKSAEQNSPPLNKLLVSSVWYFSGNGMSKASAALWKAYNLAGYEKFPTYGYIRDVTIGQYSSYGNIPANFGLTAHTQYYQHFRFEYELIDDDKIRIPIVSTFAGLNGAYFLQYLDSTLAPCIALFTELHYQKSDGMTLTSGGESVGQPHTFTLETDNFKSPSYIKMTHEDGEVFIVTPTMQSYPFGQGN